jgi:hypothetical protein
MRSLFIASVVCCLLLSPASAKDRTWTDTQGRSMRAEFIRELDGEVTLLRNGKLIALPLSRLSDKDQQYVRDVAAGKPVDEEAPASPTPASPTPASPAPASEPAPTPSPASPSPPPPPIPVVPGGLPKPDETSPPSGAPAEPFTETPAAPETPAAAPAGDAPDASDAKPDDKPIAITNRLWTDTMGQSTTAKFVRMFGRNVVLLRGNKALKIPFDNLSPADQEYLKELLISRGQEAEIPLPAPTNSEGGPAEGGVPGPGIPGPGPAAVPGMPGRPPIGRFGPGGPRGAAGPGAASGASSLDEMMQRNRDELNRRAEETRQRNAEAMQQRAEAQQQRVEEERIRQEQAAVEALERRRVYDEAQAADRARRAEADRIRAEEYEANRPAGKCSKCMRDITKAESTGTSCPHCGAVWTYKQDQFGRRQMTGAVDTRAMSWGVAVIVIIAVVAIGGLGAFIAVIVAVVRGISASNRPARRREYY